MKSSIQSFFNDKILKKTNRINSPFDDVKCILPSNIYQIVIEYAFFDWLTLIDTEDNFLKMCLHNDSELFCIMLGLRQIIELDNTLKSRKEELQNHQNQIAKIKYNITKIMVSGFLFALGGYLIYLHTRLNTAKNYSVNMVNTFRNEFAENCLQKENFRALDNLCLWDFEPIAQRFQCQITTIPITLAALCRIDKELNVKIILSILSIPILLIIALCVLCCECSNCFKKNIDSLSTSILDNHFQERIAAYLNISSIKRLSINKLRFLLENKMERAKNTLNNTLINENRSSDALYLNKLSSDCTIEDRKKSLDNIIANTLNNKMAKKNIFFSSSSFVQISIDEDDESKTMLLS